VCLMCAKEQQARAAAYTELQLCFSRRSTFHRSWGCLQVWAVDENGERHWGDVLIGADGIWSKVRKQLVGESQPVYSGYTCYTGISDFVCPDIDTVAYRVFLGNRQYFVSSDVGGGKMQWYAFHEELAGGQDKEGQAKARLTQIFGKWCGALTLCSDRHGSSCKRVLWSFSSTNALFAGKLHYAADI
jgi:2-polyprenyl-6-methoxyphenol hydroxylase-like FAD-dependent oxidoreductase